ncbi:MAG: Coenzyme F420 hydrogenase/dehydrogenase, beta subunit C-terminal domain [Candidatus Bathyarchaeota archaeon]|nr:Coenzyme F420 hydrogenase/dehydrogenase, beta subunit C-terminal domain [Candidatus Bathyarchaeota archaeon]
MADDRTEKTIEKYRNYKAQDEAKIEQEFLKGTKNENLGVYCDIFSAKSGVDGQDGGIVTALLVKGIKEGIFDSAIVVQRKEGYNAEAVVADNVNDVMAARGTKYLRVRVTPKLREIADQGKKKIAIVCTPCEVRAARKIQQTLKRNSSNQEVTILGLFCSEAFNYGKLKEEIKTRLGVDIDKAEKTQIRKGKFILHLKGKEYSCNVRDLDKAVEKGCHYCDDFSARLADISVGAVGSQNGYSTVIVRSEAGKKLLENLDIAKEDADKEEIIKLSRFKKQRAEKSFAAHQQPKNRKRNRQR